MALPSPSRAGRSEAAPQPVSPDERGKGGEQLPVPEAADARAAVRQEILDRYLWPEELQAIERNERPHRAEEAAQLREWLRNVDVERTYSDDAYYAQYFGPEQGFTRLSRSKDGEELKHAFIERVVLEKGAKLRGTDSAMRILGIARMSDGSLRFHGGDRPHEQGDPIDPLTAHALITGFETASWAKDSKQRTAALDRVIRDSYRILGREAEFQLDVSDLIDVEDLTEPEPRPEDVRKAMGAEETALRGRIAQIQRERDALLADPKATEWMKGRVREEHDRDIAELEQRLASLQQKEAAPEAAGVDSEEIARLRERIDQLRKNLAVNETGGFLSPAMREELREKIGKDIAALEGEIGKRRSASGPRVVIGETRTEQVIPEVTFKPEVVVPGAPEARPERGPTLSPEAVKAAREAYASESQKPSRWDRLKGIAGGIWQNFVGEVKHFGRSLLDARWWKERAKGLATAGVLEFFHFFKYGRAARAESKAIEDAYDSLRAEVGLAPEALEQRIKNIVDESEGRLMARLITYKDEFGEWVMEKERLDKFRDEVASRIRERYRDEQDFDRKGMRDSILRTMDPGWYRRGRWGVMSLGLAANGLALVLSRMGGRALPGPESWKVGPPKGPKAGIDIGPIEQLTGMKGTAWDTAKHVVRELKPGASSEEMVAAIRKVLEHNGIYEGHSGLWSNADHLKAVTEGAKALGRTLIDAHKMPDGFPLRIPVDEVRAILGLAAKGGAVA